MNGNSCGSSSAGSRPEVLVAALIALALGACSRPPPLSAESLQLPADRAPGFARIEARFVVGGDTEQHRAAAGTKVLEQLGRAQIHSAAEYLYHSDAPQAGTVKVRVELYEDEAAAQANWATRHHPQALAMTTPFDAGDQGWIWKDQMAGVRVGRLILEFRVKGTPPSMPALAKAYAEFAREELRT